MAQSLKRIGLEFGTATRIVNILISDRNVSILAEDPRKRGAATRVLLNENGFKRFGTPMLIGTGRPYTMDELSRLGPARQILGLTRPGISGFWQVSGRNQRTFRERIEMDCYYVRNLAIWLDLWILYRTVVAVVTREGK